MWRMFVESINSALSMTAPLPKLIGVVDDDESVRLAISALLRSAAYSAESFESAESFLKLEPPRAFDCLIVDVRMPGVDGLELQRRLDSAKSTLPIIFITAHDDPQARQKAMDAGAAGVFRKPFDSDALLAAIDTAIQKRDSKPPSKGVT